MQIKAEFFMLIGGIAAFLITLHWVRKRELREKYALGWLGISLLLLLLGLFPSLLMKTAHLLHFSYAALVSFITAGLLFLFSFSVSISLSRQHRRNIRLTQDLGLLEQRVRELETRHDDTSELENGAV